MISHIDFLFTFVLFFRRKWSKEVLPKNLRIMFILTTATSSRTITVLTTRISTAGGSTGATAVTVGGAGRRRRRGTNPLAVMPRHVFDTRQKPLPTRVVSTRG